MYRRDFLPLIEATKPTATDSERRRARALYLDLVMEDRALTERLRRGPLPIAISLPGSTATVASAYRPVPDETGSRSSVTKWRAGGR